MQDYFIYCYRSWHEGETEDIKQGHIQRVTHFVKRKVDVLLRDETIKPEKAECQWKTEISAGK